MPFAGPQALAFDRSNLERMYDILHYAHQQHHAIVDALERGQSGRAEALMREHADVVKLSINVAGPQVAASAVAQRLTQGDESSRPVGKSPGTDHRQGGRRFG